MTIIFVKKCVNLGSGAICYSQYTAADTGTESLFGLIK